LFVIGYYASILLVVQINPEREIVMKKVLSSLALVSAVTLGLSLFAAEGAQAKSTQVQSEKEVQFDLTKQEKQEFTFENEKGQTVKVGMEPVKTFQIAKDYKIGKGYTTWNTYYDVGSLMGSFYATIYVPNKGYSQITKVYNPQNRAVGGTIKDDDLSIVRKKQTKSLPAEALYRLEYRAGWGDFGYSGTASLTLKVRGTKVTTEQRGFWF